MYGQAGPRFGSGRPTCGRGACSTNNRRPQLQLDVDVDVAGRAEVVAGDEPRGERAGALVRDLRPRASGEQDRVEADAAVARGDGIAAACTPVGDHAV